MQNTMRRLGTALSGVALGLGALAVAPAAHAATSYDTLPLEQGAGWLTGRLTNGALTTSYGPDYSTSLDVAFALESAGGHDSTVSAIGSTVAAHVTDVISGEQYGDAGSTYAGATAKVAVLAQTLRQDPRAFGGVDLVDRLEAQVKPNGRLFDTSSFGDYANAIGQAYAARALTTATSPQAASVTDFLLEQQCSGGWFRLDFTKDATAADQSCDSDPTSKPDPDVTSFVLLQLADAARTEPTVANALDRAATWLASRQKADGSFGGGTSTEASNANSTGLAGWALGARGNTAAAEAAARWVRTIQAHEPVGCVTKLSTQTGAIAYDAAALVGGRASGISDAYQWQLATAQTLPVLEWLPATVSKPVVSGPAGYQAAGSTVTYRVSGAVAGDPLCLGAGSSRRMVTAGAAGTAASSVRLPASTADLTVTVADSAGVRSAVVTKALGATRPAVRLSAKKVKRGKRITVRVSGLAAGERVTLRLGRKTVRTGTAGPTGAFTAKVKVAKKQKPGRVTVTVVGQFGNRTNHKTLKVVR